MAPNRCPPTCITLQSTQKPLVSSIPLTYYSTTHNYQPRVYIDRKGNMHDPDYRHFPVLSSSPASSSSSSSYSHSRPTWETGYQSAIPDDDDDIQGDYYDPFTNHALRRSSSLTRPTTPYYPFSSSPISDFESPFDDGLEEKPCSVMKKAFRPRKCREKRRASLDSTMEESYYPEAEAVPELETDEEDEERHEKEERPAPTCSEAMKKQWQSISLTVSFGVFRARRRMRRVLSR
ncbi:uncharacterized protein EV420DRAFT_1094670 [Desarmillaria tabescens]|uniref:Uncharacterized protein n=1 Tax=Armillaria tabescens TaxID=1929756 RepID=A0AA39NDD0_ARMTA|nr:uncharacterized protein EV420DRAFT_1094670 [Desarmillaria tabescens]KAK0463539.1 hypothetical protein EV420DRAFT_1094670 [Desarmillaria tabescens]